MAGRTIRYHGGQRIYDTEQIDEMLKLDNVLDEKSTRAVENKAIVAALAEEATAREEADADLMQHITETSLPVGTTMFWPMSKCEARVVHSDRPFVFKFKGEQYTVDVEDATIHLNISINCPPGWHALDGKAELAAEEYPKLAEFIGEHNITTDGKIWLPYVQQKIIKIDY